MIWIDCTLRDGGYYNGWNFTPRLIEDYLTAMAALKVDYVELGFRSFDTQGPFRGACAYTTDEFISGLKLPLGLKLGVMMNAAELVQHVAGPVGAAKLMFAPAATSPVGLVRFACHLHEFEAMLPTCDWLKTQGYTVGINLMQIADRTDDEVLGVARAAQRHPLDALYFADSLGSMAPDDIARVVRLLASEWQGCIGVHAHDNMGNAIANSLRALDEGATWVDSTVTGMGRGPGNAQTEYLAVALSDHGRDDINLTPLMSLIGSQFRPLKEHYGWGTNTFYYLAGKYGIHPTYIQEMLGDSRFSDEDILAVIEHLRQVGGKKFKQATLTSARNFYQGPASGKWQPRDVLLDQEVLILGSGPGASEHRHAIESYIRRHQPVVIALNTQGQISEDLIAMRAACHPLRLLADIDTHLRLTQPLITPLGMLPPQIATALKGKSMLDFGISVEVGKFVFHPAHAVVPASLVMAYCLAIAASGGAKRVLLAGFDGYGADDPRQAETDNLFKTFMDTPGAVPLRSITPTQYSLPSLSVYSL